MEKEIMEQLQVIMQAMERMESRMATKDDLAKMATKEDLAREIKASEARMKTYIENRVEKKIEALFDGYKLTHEKQWELERRMDKLEEIIADLQNKIA